MNRVRPGLVEFVSIHMTGGFRLTAQAYAECWRERIHSEQVALANTLQQEQQRKLAAAEAETAALRKAVEAASAQPAAVGVHAPAAAPAAAGSVLGSTMSSRLSTAPSAADSAWEAIHKITSLEKKLNKERLKREELEKALEMAKQKQGVVSS